MFTFTLQPVLDHRQFVEDALKKELAEIKARLHSERERLAMLKRKEMQTNQDLTREQARGLSSAQVVAYYDYLTRLVHRIAEQMTVIEGIEARESETQKKMLEAAKKRQILEKLKAQGLERYQKTLLAEEAKFLDEIAVNQFVRKTIQGRGEGK